MSAQPDFSIIKIGQLSLCFDTTKGGPVVKKVEEILKAMQERPQEDISRIINDVTNANRCMSYNYKRRGRRRWGWGFYEAEPEEEVAISIRGHFCGPTSSL